ncbi:hypothetical protein FISHEDRAFT_11479, partial [Fistulina hepatica ATCC 64428]
TGLQKLFDFDKEHNYHIFYERKMGQEVPAYSLGDEWEDYVVRISDGNDKQSFPTKQSALLPHRAHLLLSDGHSCYRPRCTGENNDNGKTAISGPTMQPQTDLRLRKQGDNEIPGLTDQVPSKRLGLKRASHIRSMFALSKEDDVREACTSRQLHYG